MAQQPKPNDQPGRSDGAVQVATGGVGHDTADGRQDPAKSEHRSGAPLPHERDQALGSVDDQPREVIKQAKRDLDAGQVDTDMRATPGLDADRREQLVPTPGPSAGKPAGQSAGVTPGKPAGQG